MREDEKDDEERGEQQAAASEYKQQHSIIDRVTRRPSKPNPYNYYQKLVQDFQSLDKELQVAASVQNDLHSKVDALQAQRQASDQEHQQTQYTQWEREREFQIETIVRKSVEIEALHSKVDELDAQELRLLAEIQMLQEKQQEEIRTEAFRINELVHTKTHLLEAELAKGKMDLEFIAQLVKKTHSLHSHDKQEERESACGKGSIHAIAEEIQTRRRREFDLATESLNARLLSFEHEKEALSKRASDIRTRKQRALQILSTNQQEAIKAFFSSAPTSDSDAKKKKAAELAEESTATEAPQLDFSSILASLNQSGAQVEQIQSARNEKVSARKSMEEALHDAQATLAVGEKRIEALQKTISDRKRDVGALNIFPKDSAVVYDGKMGIESYAPAMYELVYFVRGLVFSWVDRAVAQVGSEPNMELLESEVHRWEVTHIAVEQEHNAHLRYQLAGSQMSSIIDEVVREIAGDIHNEFRSDCSRVREKIGSVFRDVFFANTIPGGSNTKPTADKRPLKNSLSSSSPVLAADLFSFAFEQLQSTRKRQAAISYEQTHERVQFLQLMTQPTKMGAARLTIDGKAPHPPSELPKKKRFGLFSASKASETVTNESHALNVIATTKALGTDEQQLTVVTKERVEMIQPRPTPTGTLDRSANIAAEKQFWQQMLVEVDKIAVPSTFSHSSCVEISSDASVCVAGTTSGELLAWDLLHQPPLLLRSHVPPPKSTRSSISRIAFSANKARIITLDQLKVLNIWSVNKILKPGNAQQHSSDCFTSEDPKKWKPQPLELLIELNSESLLRPGFSEETRQWIPNEKSSTPILPAQFLCTNWFSTTSLVGEQPSFICGISTGDILKSNIGTPGQWFDTEVAAKFDAPTPSDLMNGLRFKNSKREFFCGHKHPVLFIKCLQSSSASTGVKLLSIDSDGMVLEWEYDSKHFSGFGWFTPVRRNRLDLQPPTSSDASHAAAQKGTATSSTEKKRGEILQIAATADEKRVVLMVFFENPATKKSNNPGRLVFYQLLLTPASKPIQLSPVRIQLEFTGTSSPPRFALSTVFPSGKRSHGGSGHFLFVLMNNSVQIMSLDTGENCCALIALQQKSEPSLVFNSIAVSARCVRKERLRCCMTVAGDRHNRILIYRFKQQQQQR